MNKTSIDVFSPLTGNLIPLERVPDEVFAQKMMGEGIAIEPIDFIVRSPVAGKVSAVTRTKHAISVLHPQGVELLIHIGIDSVALDGKGFSLLVDEGQEVDLGTPLIAFDPMELIQANIKSLISPVLVTEPSGYSFRFPNLSEKVDAQKSLLFTLIPDATEATNPDGQQSEHQEPPKQKKEDESSPVQTFSLRSNELLLPNRYGLHARPAALFAETAKQFACAIELLYQDKAYNGKSAVALMKANLRQGSSFHLECKGLDAQETEQAMASLQALLNSWAENEPAPPQAAPPQGSDSNGPLSAVPPSAGITTFPSQTTVLNGKGVGKNEAGGTALLYQDKTIPLIETSKGNATELADFRHAIEKASTQLLQQINQGAEQTQNRNTSAEHTQTTANIQREIFSAHKSLLEDIEIHKSVEEEIAKGKSAGVAWHFVLQGFHRELLHTQNSLLAERAADVIDVQNRVLRALYNLEETMLPAEPNDATEQHKPKQQKRILLAEDLTPSQFVALFPSGAEAEPNTETEIAGICLVKGGVTSHIAILSESRGLPLLVGCPPSLLTIASNTPLIVSGKTSTLTVNPSPEQMKQLQEANQRRNQLQEVWLQQAKTPAITTDGTQISVAANAEDAKGVASALQRGGEEIGLLRTEFVFARETSAPNVERQYGIYKEILDAAQGKTVVFRTLDIGGDKPLPYVTPSEEENPLMGLRGIRSSMTLEDTTAQMSLFRTQIQALLQLQARGQTNYKILLPMVSELSELVAAKRLIKEESDVLGIRPVPIGIMIEVPSAALLASQLVGEADFFSVGTNDLSQYVLAMDRTHPQLNPQAYHPAVLRLIEMTAQAAQEGNIPIAVCGALASDPQFVPLLIGLGVNQLSVVPSVLPEVKAVIRGLSLAQAKELAHRAVAMSSAAEVKDWVYACFMEKHAYTKDTNDHVI